jgi:rhamnosyltransferase
MEEKREINKPKCAVFMSAYNGERFIAQQIESILNQSDVDVCLYIRDDGSTDNTRGIISNFSQDARVQVFYGKNIGYGKSFLELLYSAPCEYDCYAFSDQDDIWDSDKLIMAWEHLKSIGEPALYYCRLRIVDENGTYICDDKSFRRMTKCTVYSASKTNLIRGCSMVWNCAMHTEIMRYKPDINIIRVHDIWISWVAIIVGKLVYDDSPRMNYRQLYSSASPGAHGMTESMLTHKLNVWRYVWSSWDGMKYEYAKELERIFPDFSLATCHYKESFLFRLELLFSRKYNEGIPLKWRIISNIMIMTNRL